jgi:hypothetical protein
MTFRISAFGPLEQHRDRMQRWRSVGVYAAVVGASI